MTQAVKENENQNSIRSFDNINNKNLYRCGVKFLFEVEMYGTSEEDVKERLENTHPADLYAMRTDEDKELHDVDIFYMDNLSQIRKGNFDKDEA